MGVSNSSAHSGQGGDGTELNLLDESICSMSGKCFGELGIQPGIKGRRQLAPVG